MRNADEVRASKMASKAKRKSKANIPGARAFSCRAKELRDSHGLTLQDVGGEVGVSPQTVIAIEAGRDCMLTTAIKIAEFFGETVEDIWEPFTGPLTGKK
jgi:DNA-binding XRE family transcriptional regulator